MVTALTRLKRNVAHLPARLDALLWPTCTRYCRGNQHCTSHLQVHKVVGALSQPALVLLPLHTGSKHAGGSLVRCGLPVLARWALITASSSSLQDARAANGKVR